MASYANIAAPTNPEEFQGGYKDEFYLCPLGDFTTLQSPLTTTALGDKYTIESAHTHPVGKGFYKWETKQGSVKLTSQPVGDKGARLSKYFFELIVVTDGAVSQEQMNNIMNQKNIYMIKQGNCLVADAYEQLGDGCKQASVTAEFNGGEEEGLRTWLVKGEVVAKRFFYTAALTEVA